MRLSVELYALTFVLLFANLFAVVAMRNPQAVYAAEKTAPIISGVVVAKQDNTLTLKDGVLLTSISIPDQVDVKRNSLQSSLQHVQVGDQVAISENDSGQVQAMEVVSGEVVQLGKWLIPLSFGGIGILILSSVLSRKIKYYAQQVGSAQTNLLTRHHISAG